MPSVKYLFDVTLPGAPYASGIPARDLTHEEYEERTDDEKRVILEMRHEGKHVYRVTGATAERERLGLVEPVAADAALPAELLASTADVPADTPTPPARAASKKGGE